MFENYMPQFQAQTHVDRRMQIGRTMLQSVANMLRNQQLQNNPHNVDSALLAIANSQLALRGWGGEEAMPLPATVAWGCHLMPGPSSVPIPSPTLTGVVRDVGA